MNNKFIFYSLLSCFFIILAIQISSGLFGWLAFCLVILAFFLEILSLYALFKPHVSVCPAYVIVFFLIIEIGLGLFKPYVKYNEFVFMPLLLKIINGASLLLIATYFLKGCPKFLKNRFMILFSINVLGKILVVCASPHPLIDVWQIMQETSACFLLGMNPYEVPIHDIYNNIETISFKGFNYWPMTLLFILPFHVLFGDVRFGMIAGEAIGIIALYRLIKKKFAETDMAKLLEVVILMFLIQPRGFLVIEQSWNEPLIIGIFAIFLYGYYFKYSWADFFLGLALALKQTLIICLFPLFSIYKFKYQRYLIMTFTFLFIILPFFFWDMEGFLRNSVKLHLDLGPRFDALTLTSFLRHAFDIGLPTWIGPTLAVMTAIIAGIALKRFSLAGYLKGLTLSYFILFIFGKQAFCNYYYFLTFLQVSAIFFFTIHIKPDIYISS